MFRVLNTLFLLLPVVASAQVNIINRSLTDSSLKIVYSGVENIIEVKDFAFTLTTRIRVSNGEIISVDKNKIKLIPKAGSKECLIGVENLHTDSKEYTDVFKVDSLPNPVVRFSNSYDSASHYPGVNAIYMKFADFLSTPPLFVYYPNSFYKHNCMVTKFHITFDSSNPNLITEFIINDNKLNEKHIEAFKKYINGCYVAVDMIEINCAGIALKKNEPFIFQVKKD